MTTTEKQRLLGTIQGKPVDRTPVVIPGGMMAGTLVELIKNEDLLYPEIHTNPHWMATYTRSLQKTCQVDNLGVPFCMTVEAECFGAEVDLGNLYHEPRIGRSPYADLNNLLKSKPIFTRRYHAVIEAIHQLTNDTIPVIGNLVGPMSVLTSLVDQGVIYRALEKDKELLKKSLDVIGDFIIQFGETQLSAGADLIVLADPSAAGDIVGPDYFQSLIQPVYQRIVVALKSKGNPLILHICGRVSSLTPVLESIPWDVLSVDSMISLKRLRRELKHRLIMGNVSTHLLASGNQSRIATHARKVADITDILSPACGLPTKTPLANVVAMAAANRS